MSTRISLPQRFDPAGLVLSFLMATHAVGASIGVISEPQRTFGLGDVRSVAVSSDRRFVATAGQAGAFLWDLQSGTLLRPLKSAWSVTSLAFAPDSQTLLGASAAAVRAWSTESGAVVRDYPRSVGDIFSLQFSADGRTFVSVAGEGTAHVWSVDTGELIDAVQKPELPFFAAALSPDGRLLATLGSSRTNSVTLWDVAQQRELRSLLATNWTADRALFTSDGQLVTSAGGLGVLLWDVETGKVLRSFGGVEAPTFLMNDLWMPDGSTLAALGNDGRIFLWNLATAELTHIVPGAAIVAGTGVPGAFLAVVAGDDSIPRLREFPSGRALQSYPGHTTSTHTAVAISPHGQYVLSGGTEPGTRLWNRRTGQPIRELISSGSGSMSAAFSPDGSNILTTVGLPAPGARLWDVETGALVREFRWSGSYPMCAAFSTDGNLVAAGAQDDRVRIFHTATGRLLRTLVGSGWMRSVAFSSTAPILACGSTDSSARVYHLETGALLHTAVANAGQVITVAISPNGETLLVGWSDGLVRLFKTSTFGLRQEFVTQAAFLESATFSPDGQYILTGEGWPAFTATLWDALTVQPLRVFAGHRAPVSAVAFSRDGSSILTAGERVREWSVSDLAARLRFQQGSHGLRLAWSVGLLQFGSTPTGPWQIFPDAISPLELTAEHPAGFYRVSVDAEPSTLQR